MLSYYVAGNPQAPLVILMHGVTDCAVAWADYIEHLARTYCVVAIDSLGHGFSPRYSAEDLLRPFKAAVDAAEDTIEFVERLFGGRAAVLVAHSMGGAIATVLGIRHPKLFRGLVLEDPAWLSPEQQRMFRDNAAASTDLLLGWREDPAGAVAENRTRRAWWPVEDHLGWALGKCLTDPELVRSGVVSFSASWIEVAAQLSVPTVVVSSDQTEDLVGVAGLKRIDSLGNPLVSSIFIPGAEHTLRRAQNEAFNAAIDPLLWEWSGD